MRKKSGTNELCPMCPQLIKERDAACGEITRLYDSILLAEEATHPGASTLPIMIIQTNYLLRETIRRHIEDWLGGQVT